MFCYGQIYSQLPPTTFFLAFVPGLSCPMLPSEATNHSGCAQRSPMPLFFEIGAIVSRQFTRSLPRPAFPCHRTGFDLVRLLRRSRLSRPLEPLFSALPRAGRSRCFQGGQDRDVPHAIGSHAARPEGHISCRARLELASRPAETRRQVNVVFKKVAPNDEPAIGSFEAVRTRDSGHNQPSELPETIRDLRGFGGFLSRHDNRLA